MVVTLLLWTQLVGADPPELLAPVVFPLARRAAAASGSLRAGPASVDMPLLLGDPPMLSLDLFGDTRVVAVRTRAYRPAAHVLVWEGDAVGDSLAAITIVVANGVVTANIFAVNATYTIAPLAGPRAQKRGLSLLSQANPTANKRDGDPITVPGTGSPPPQMDLSGSTQVNRVEVGVFYTAKALAYAGSAAALEAHVRLATAVGNRAILDSGVKNLVLEVTVIQLTDYVEAGNMSIDLKRLVTSGDGHLDTIIFQRDIQVLDILSLWTVASDYCGLGYTPDGFPTAAFANSAAHVVDISCAINAYSFIHEIGHNFGMLHDRAHASATGGAYRDFGYGYQQPTGLWRTLMAYDCAPKSCPRLPYFSTPVKYYKGRALGVANAADNARVLRNTAAVVSDFRYRARGDYTTNFRVNSTISASIPTAKVCGTYTSGNIRDGSGGLLFQMNVAAPATSGINDLDVEIEMKHASIRDLRIRLAKNSLNTYLYSGEGCNGLTNVRRRITFDDAAPTYVGRFNGTGCTGATRIAPSMPLSLFNGRRVAGMYSITIADAGPGTAGTVFGICLVFRTRGTVKLVY